MTHLIVAGALMITPSFQAEESAWRAKRHERLTSETGWLTLIGLHWLQEGENTVPGIGVFTLQQGTVRLKASGTLPTMPIKSDEKGEPDVIRVDDLQATLIKRGPKLGIRVRNPKSSVRTGFKGLQYFEPSEKFKIEAKFERYKEPQDRKIPTIIGIEETMKSPGVVKFKLKGKEYSLEPMIEDPQDNQLFYIFRDETSGKETYPAGRFMYSDMPKNGKVILNFNRAYNPPCAFTEFATCPLPPPQNNLRIKIEAGEKTYGEH